MLPDRVSNPGPLTYESGALPIALRGPTPTEKRSPAVQWTKCWRADIAVSGSIPAEDGNPFPSKGCYIANNFSLSTSHRPDMTEILLSPVKYLDLLFY